MADHGPDKAGLVEREAIRHAAARLKRFLPVMLAASFSILVMSMLQAEMAGGHLIGGQNLALGRDFVNFWNYGHSAWFEAPARYFDTEAYNAALDSFIPGYDYPDQRFSYPPHYMLLAAPFGLLPYYAALGLYTGLGLILVYACVIPGLGPSGVRHAMWAAPALVFCIICGQASMFPLVIFALVMKFIDTRPVFAGLLIALLTVKPQLGLLIPFFLLLTGRWTVFAAAVLGTLGFLGTSLLLHGVEVWRIYLFEGVSGQSAHMAHAHPFTRGLMPTVLVNGVTAGLPPAIATGLHALVSAGVLGLAGLAVRRTRDQTAQFMVMLTASFAVTPYLMAYDTLILAWAALVMISARGASPAELLIFKLLSVLIPVGVVMSLAGLPGSALVTLGMFAWALAHARGDSLEELFAWLRVPGHWKKTLMR